jgi:hypothetical protein
MKIAFHYGIPLQRCLYEFERLHVEAAYAPEVVMQYPPIFVVGCAEHSDGVFSVLLDFKVDTSLFGCFWHNSTPLSLYLSKIV